MKPYNILISGGGTGGHIYPAIAIANEIKLRYPDANFLFVGAKDRMEMEKVPQAGYDIKGLWISGIQRKLTIDNLLFPLKFISSLWNANRIIKRFKPDVAIGTGGFASGPTLIMANRKGIPTLIQEQNSFPGITNKLLSKKANKVCVAYDYLERFFPLDKIIKTILFSTLKTNRSIFLSKTLFSVFTTISSKACAFSSNRMVSKFKFTPT